MELKKLIEKKRLDHLDVFDDLRDHYEKIIHCFIYAKFF